MHTTALVLALAGAAAAKHCKNITVPVDIKARNAEFDLKPLATEIETTNFFLDLSRPGNNATAKYLKDYKTVSGKYKLAATYCEPDSGPGSALQVLTHGVGFDRSYWDFPFQNYNYSYVNRAIEAGYSTLSWDRLGIAQSSHGDPINEIQIFLEIAALKELTQQAKDGHLCGVQHKFDKTVHIGHSFGSAMTYGLTNMYPDITDAIVLTGFSQVPMFMAYFALGGNFSPVKENKMLAQKYADGYIAPKDSIGVHINFFGPDDFDPEILKVATETGQPASFGELLTVGSGAKESEFTGSVFIVTGDKDIPFCGGNCTSTMAIKDMAPDAKDLIDFSKPSFKKASSFNSTIIPKAGHGLNFAYTAPQTYKAITDFIKASL